MKKVTIFALTVGLFLGLQSCKEITESAKTSAQEAVETAKNTAVDEAKAIGVPTFTDAEVQAYVDSYESYIADYKKVVENKDLTAFASMATKSQELTSKGQAIMTKLKGAELEKFTAYIVAKSVEVQELAKEIMP